MDDDNHNDDVDDDNHDDDVDDDNHNDNVDDDNDIFENGDFSAGLFEAPAVSITATKCPT